MLTIGTIEHPIDYLKKEKVKTVTLDIETMDSRPLGLWEEPIVSYAVSFPSGPVSGIKCPTVGLIAESPLEEAALVSHLISILTICRKHGITLCGHNISYSYKHVPDVAPWKNGYDLPKIMKRAFHHGLNPCFIPQLEVFDTMDMGVVRYNHCQHNRVTPIGTKQRILGIQQIEEDFNIIRPKGQQKLGPLVREFYLEYLKEKNSGRLNQILLYNCVDSITESIVSKLFIHCMEECHTKSGLISPRTPCAHIPPAFRLDQMPEWKALSNSRMVKFPVKDDCIPYNKGFRY
jgi:hypothetical protein